MGNSLEACETTTTTHEHALIFVEGKETHSETVPCEHHDKPVIAVDESSTSIGAIPQAFGLPLGYKYTIEKQVTEHEVPEEPRLPEDEIPSTLKKLNGLSHAG